MYVCMHVVVSIVQFAGDQADDLDGAVHQRLHRPGGSGLCGVLHGRLHVQAERPLSILIALFLLPVRILFLLLRQGG